MRACRNHRGRRKNVVGLQAFGFIELEGMIYKTSFFISILYIKNTNEVQILYE
jgi:hypothetical protein